MTSPRTTLRATLLVAQLYLHRGWRRAIARPRSLALRIGFFVAVWLSVVLVGTPGTSLDVDTVAVRETTRGLVVLLWLGHVGIAAVSTPTSARAVQGSGFLLRAAGVRPTLWGTMLGQYARRLLFFGVFAVATALVLLWGVDLPNRDPLLLLAILVLFLTAELTGMTLRLGVAATGIRVGPAGRVVFAGAGLVVFSLAVEEFEATMAVLSSLPIAAFGDAFLLGVPGADANRTAVVAVVAGSLVAMPVLGLAIERLAARTWFTGDQRELAGADRTSIGEWLARVGFEGPTRAVAWRLWLQSRRKPVTLGLLAVPALVVGLALLESGETDIPLFPLFIGLYTVWMATVAVALNPLSSEDGTLPHLLSAPGKEIVTGYALTAVVVGLPITLVTVVLGGLLVGPAALTIPGMVVGAAVFLGAVPAAIALGVSFPRLDVLPVEASGPIAPGKFTIAGHTFVVGLLATPAVVPLALADGWHSPPVYAGIAVTVACSLLVGGLARRVAAGRLDEMTLD